MKRIKTIQRIIDSGVVAVIRADSKEKAARVITAVKAGGIKVVEITMTIPNAVDIIKELCNDANYKDIIIGAGTVLDAETARLCILTGAQFIVSPAMNVDLVKLCNRYRVPVMPGATTPAEVLAALDYGVEIIKIFPANVYGPSLIKSLKGPFPQANFMPTGGVTPENIKDWMNAGAVAVGTGSELTKSAATGDYEQVTKMAASFMEALKQARAGK